MTASPSDSLQKLAIIAGGGTAPQRLIEACQRLGREFFVVCLEGQADKSLGEGLPHVWLPFGAGSKFKELVAREKLTEAVMIGRVRRPSLLEIKPDFLTLKVLAKMGINLLGDDALLRAIGKAIEDETGMRLIGVQDVFSDLLTPKGNLTQRSPDESALIDIKRGVEIARTLGKIDVGQAVIVQQGIVLGLEAIEGTNALIERSATLKREGTGGVLIKLAKPSQDPRFDLPTIGPETITAMANAGLSGVALEAHRSLLIERDLSLDIANQAGLFIVAFEMTDFVSL